MTVLYPNMCYNTLCYKVIALYYYLNTVELQWLELWLNGCNYPLLELFFMVPSLLSQ